MNLHPTNNQPCPIFPGGHPPSIFGTSELNYRVRDGNCLLYTSLYRNQTEKLPKNDAELPVYAQDFDLSTFLSALYALPVTYRF